METVSHHIRGEDFHLLPEKAVFWAGKQALLVADLHLGKVTHFRKAGIGLPKEVELENFGRLAQLILNYEVAKVYILGDLFHSHKNEEWQVFKNFIGQFPEIQFILIKGNHDILELEAYTAPNMAFHPEQLALGPFLLTHFPLDQPSKYYNICGHIHPGVKLRGKGLQSLKLPCFHFGRHGLVLPAFGAFTGTAKIEPHKEDSIYAISSHSVIKVQ